LGDTNFSHLQCWARQRATEVVHQLHFGLHTGIGLRTSFLQARRRDPNVRTIISTCSGMLIRLSSSSTSTVSPRAHQFTFRAIRALGKQPPVSARAGSVLHFHRFVAPSKHIRLFCKPDHHGRPIKAHDYCHSSVACRSPLCCAPLLCCLADGVEGLDLICQLFAPDAKNPAIRQRPAKGVTLG